MPKDKRIVCFLALFTAELFLTYLIIVVINKRYLFNSAWLSDKFYVFQISSFYQIGNTLIGVHDNGAYFVRHRSKRKLNLYRVAQSTLFAFCVTSILLFFSVIGFFSNAQFYGPSVVINLLAACIKIFLSLIVLAEVTLILSISRLQWLRHFPKLISFLLLALEILVVVPQINRFSNFNICICYSWIFYKNNLVGIGALVVIISWLLIYILWVANKKDLCI